MADETKTTADQIGEISKLVEDAQDKLDQVMRALRMLQDKFNAESLERNGG